MEDFILSKHGFQSLFYWKFYFNLYFCNLTACYGWFQSLFYWKFYFNRTTDIHKMYNLRGVSILILLEVLLQPSCIDQHRSAIRCFNPYFTGSSTSTSPSTANNLFLISCFNPYFTGSSTSTRLIWNTLWTYMGVSILILLEVLLQLNLQHDTHIEFRLWFQSLFYWKFYFNNDWKVKKVVGNSRFQSLFYWKFYFNVNHAEIINWYKDLFQSLFYWKFYFNLQHSNCWRNSCIVSILILLEVLLQQY